MTDALRELSTPEIIELSAFYKKLQHEAPHIHSHLETALKWKNKEPGKCFIQVYVPQDGWSNHGTFVSIGHFSWKLIITYTLEESGNILKNVLSQTNHFDYEKNNVLYYALHEKHIPIVDEAMIARGLKKQHQDNTDLWKLDRETAASKSVSVPSGFVMANLQPGDSNIVNDVWPHKSPGSELYVKALIEMNESCGLYTENDNILAAWVLKSQLGQLALLQVDNQHKRKGLALSVINKLSKDIANDGFPVAATIVTDNFASQKLFTKAGFEKMFLAAFILYK